MSTINITVPIDEELKEQFASLCGEIGLSVGSAFTMFAKAAVEEHRLPLEVSEPMPNRETIEAMLEAERLSRDPNTKRYNSFREAFDEVMADETI